jgi:hypothetical protein
LGLTAAELDPAHKNRISHRGLHCALLAGEGWRIGIDELNDEIEIAATSGSQLT